MNNWLLLLEQNQGAWLTVSLAASAVLLFCVLVLWLNLLSFKKKFKQLMRGAEGSNIEQLLQAHLTELSTYRALAEENRTTMAEISEKVRHCVQHVGVKRYNAFEDVGSRLSFSVALLDDQLDGVILTGIYGRQESTTYAKGIQRGHSEQHLSIEEMDAMKIAREQQAKRKGT